MSLGSAPKAPPPVDQEALITRQAEENRITQFTPLGDIRFGEIGDEGQFVPGTGGAASFIDLPPESQAIFDVGQATAGELAERGLLQAISLPAEPINFEGLPQFSSEIDFSGLTDLPGIDDFSSDATRVEDATFQRAVGLLNPEFDLQEERLRQTLANQGLPIGSEAFEGEFDRFDRIEYFISRLFGGADDGTELVTGLGQILGVDFVDANLRDLGLGLADIFGQRLDIVMQSLTQAGMVTLD